MRRALVGIPLALLLVGCGSATSTPATEAAGGSPDESAGASPSAAPEKLTCPTRERVGTEGGALAEWPEGVEDPEQLVEEQSTPEEPWVLSGKKAYVLRPDGTAFEVHDVVKGPNGWFLHGYEACAD